MSQKPESSPPAKPSDSFVIESADTGCPMIARGGDLSLIGGMGACGAPDGDVVVKAASGKELLRIGSDGTVTFADGFDEREAVRAFWSALAREHPAHVYASFVLLHDAFLEMQAAWKRVSPVIFEAFAHSAFRVSYPELMERMDAIHQLAETYRAGLAPELLAKTPRKD